MGFTQGLSGVKAANTDLNVTGNNIANASTVGFKSSRVEFGDAYTNSILAMGKDPIGAGVRVESVTQKFNQGNISSTDSSLDMAIDGQGFFILNNNGTQTYTRAGQFGVDKDGFIVSNLGGRLQGYPAVEGGNVGGILSDLQLETGTQPPRSTHLIEAALNVPAASKVLEEIGSVTSTNGLAIGVAQVGQLVGTRSSLQAFNPPVTAGTPAQFNGNPIADDVVWRSDAMTFPATLAQFDVTLGGAAPVTVTPLVPGAVDSVFEAVSAINAGIAAIPSLNGQIVAEQDPTDPNRIRFSSPSGRPFDMTGPLDNALPTPTGVASVAGSGVVTFPFSDTGGIEITLSGPAITGTINEVITPFANSASNSVTDMVNALNIAIRSNENLNGKMRAELDPSDPSQIRIQTTGLYASDGTNLTIEDDGTGGNAFAALALNGTTPDVTPAVGLSLFQNGGIDLLSVEGTPVSVQGNLPTTLEFNAFVPGSASVLTGNSIVGFPLASAAAGNTAVFNVSAAAGTGTVTLNVPAIANGDAADGWANYNDFRLDMNNALNAAFGGAGAPQLPTTLSGGRLQLVDVYNGTNSISVTDNLSASDADDNGFTMAALGLTSAAGGAVVPGEPDLEANNQFIIEKTGIPNGQEVLTIPTGTYATPAELVAEINIQIQSSPALRDQVFAEAVNGRIVFNTTQLGSENGNGLDVRGIAGSDAGLEAIGHASQTRPQVIDPYDRRHSFRVNLSVPLPDPEQRSGSVEVSLNEDIKTIEQLAAAINRELASAPADEYIGVEAQVTLDEFGNKLLEFVATEAGEAAVVSVTNITAEGEDISVEEVFAMLQVDPTTDTNLTLGQPGIDNGYPTQTMTLTNPDGEESTVTTPEGATAAEISALLSDLEGVQASATTTAKILAQDFTHSGDMTIYINGQPLESRNLADLANEINGYQQTSLNGTTASIDPETGDLLLTNALGVDLTFEIESDSETDSIIVQGEADTAPVVLGGVLSDADAARVGGAVEIILNKGYTLDEPNPRVAGLFNGLSPADFDEYVLNEFDPNNPDTYNETASMTIYDSLGNPHRAQFYYVKDANDPARPFDLNSWTVYVTIDGENVGDPDPTLPFPENTQATMASYKMYFNADGTLNEGATGTFLISNWDPIDEDGNPNGAYTSVNVAEGASQPITEPNLTSNFVIDPASTTQYGSPFARNILRQDGYASGRLKDIEVDNDGQVFARYTNGEAQLLGQVALASFVNNEGLSPIGDTQWVESFESGNPTIGEANSGTFGNIRSSSLEDSTVDLAEQLVHLIVAQRNYQASAKTIETANAVTQTIINLR
ncbi:flagellar hook-basal body complex protein [Salinibius halmophilus]|uniref:flagellar hook-basal body complex protein n=1 Tax=Salinibius halmophilus TaxID=1853216 RepID=UPI000E676100|nr:flagellar hook-basal body complex protein [Salinibius halmophilus]